MICSRSLNQLFYSFAWLDNCQKFTYQLIKYYYYEFVHILFICHWFIRLTTAFNQPVWFHSNDKIFHFNESALFQVRANFSFVNLKFAVCVRVQICSSWIKAHVLRYDLLLCCLYGFEIKLGLHQVGTWLVAILNWMEHKFFQMRNAKCTIIQNIN